MAAPKGNQFAKGNSGKPKRYRTPQSFEEKVEAYFEYCDSRKRVTISKTGEKVEVANPKPYTVQGLALYLGFSSTATLWDYANLDSHKEYHAIAKKAMLKIYADKIEGGMEGRYNSQVVTLDLKCNYGWVDTTKQVVEAKVETTQTVDLKNLSDDQLEALAGMVETLKNDKV